MSCTRAYFPLLEVRHRVDPITINIPISTRFRVHIGTVSLHGKVQMSSRGIARIPHVANNLPLGDILSYAYERRRLHMHIDGSQVRAAIARFRVCALDKNAVAHGRIVGSTLRGIPVKYTLNLARAECVNGIAFNTRSHCTDINTGVSRGIGLGDTRRLRRPHIVARTGATAGLGRAKLPNLIVCIGCISLSLAIVLQIASRCHCPPITARHSQTNIQFAALGYHKSNLASCTFS